MSPEGPGLAPPRAFLDAAAALGIEFDPGDTDRLGAFLALLLEANRSFNLTAITDPDQAWTRHMLDSLTLVPLLADLPPGTSVIDVGSGGGLPGVPLAIVLPSLRVTLLEATGKKAEFLRSVAERLRLSNVTVVRDRAELIAHKGKSHRAAYDAVVARAVGRLPVLVELCAPLAKVGGRLLLIKGERAEEELADAAGALRTLHLHHAGTVATPTGRVVVLEKTRQTPAAYPRRGGEPQRSPLGLRGGHSA
jgi:16S rRNA (guanine527-N7)-methyltransferase